MSSGGSPATRFSIVGRLQADNPDVRARALEAFAAAYWVAVSRYIRYKWRLDAEHAANLTQEFFARTLESPGLTASIRRGPGFAPTCVCWSTDRYRTRARPIAG